MPSSQLRKRLDTFNEYVQSQEITTDPQLLKHKSLPHKPIQSSRLSEKPSSRATEQILGDVKIFINVMFHLVKFFYEPVLNKDEIDLMTEDILESITNIILSNDVYKIVFSFIRLEFTELEGILREQLNEYKRITPEECKINQYFRLDRTSPLLQVYSNAVISESQRFISEQMSIN